MFYKTLFLSAATACAFSPSAFAQTQVETDEIVITSTRLDQTASESGTSLSIITRADIEQLGFDFVVDALASAPGVTVNQNGAFGGNASVRIRGASSEQTLVLIDGISVNDPTSPGGGFNFARLDTANIERIEILKGPQSTLWGGDAIGGVVNITTKRAKPGVSLSGFAEAGRFNTLRGGASVGISGDVGDFRLAYSGIRTDGISKADEANGNDETDPFDSTTFSGSGGINLGKARLDTQLLFTAAEVAFDSFVFGNQGNVGDGDEISETTEFSGHVSLNLPLFGGRLENLFLIGYSEIERDNFSDNVPSFSAEGDRTIFRYQGNFTVNDHNSLAFGAEREESRTGRDETAIDGLFGLYELKPIDALTLTAGVRVDDHERFGSETTGRLAAAYDLNTQLTLRATVGQGFKAPTIFQTTFFCCGATAANADLQPERSDGFDVGADYRTIDGKGEISVSYFDQTVDNLIDFSFASGGYINIPGADRSGIELSGSYQLSSWLNIAAGYAYIDAKNNEGDALARVPENSANVTFGFTPDGPISGAVLVRYNGEEQDSNGLVGDWTRVDLNAAYQINSHVEFYGRVENLLSEDYQQILGFGTPGRSAYIGVRLRY